MTTALEWIQSKLIDSKVFFNFHMTSKQTKIYSDINY